MKKQNLLQMPKLNATPTMMNVAMADTPRVKSHGYWKETVREWDVYLRALVSDGILKVALYWPEYMRARSKEPIFLLFIDRVSEKFLTYDRVQGKWRTAQLQLLPWPSYLYKSCKSWISDKDRKLIRDYLGGEDGQYHNVCLFQSQIREKELAARHKKETDPWDRDMEQVPDTPKDWDKWVSKVGIPENYIFYKYTRKGAQTGYCTYCEKEVPIKNPRYNKQGTCPCCRHHVIFKSVGKAKWVETKKEWMYLFQRCRDGFVIREFLGRRFYRDGKCQLPEHDVRELRRVIYDRSTLQPRAYIMGVYKNTIYRWIADQPCDPMWTGDTAGRIYGRTLPDLGNKELQYTGLREHLLRNPVFDPELYLAALTRKRILEKVSKAGLDSLANDLIKHANRDFSKISIEPNEPNLAKALRLNRKELKRLRAADGDIEYLKWLQYENVLGKPIADTVISWFCREKIRCSEMDFIWDKMAPQQVYNYVQRQMQENGMTSAEVITTWRDYLSMAKRLGIDTEDEIIYRVRKLKLRHDELIIRSHEGPASEEAKKLEVRFPDVNEIYRSIKDKYTFAKGKYAVVVPDGIKDIIQEGRFLTHCVDTHATYFDRISRRETYILFLRKADAIQIPYYTLEVEPDGTIRQKRSKFDRQYEDIQEASAFLREWQSEVSKRINETDRKLGEESNRLRIDGYAQLKNDHITINFGEKQGQLLYKVLEEDLMKVAA